MIVLTGFRWFCINCLSEGKNFQGRFYKNQDQNKPKKKIKTVHTRKCSCCVFVMSFDFRVLFFEVEIYKGKCQNRDFYLVRPTFSVEKFRASLNVFYDFDRLRHDLSHTSKVFFKRYSQRQI